MRIAPENRGFNLIKLNSNLVGNSPDFKKSSKTEDGTRKDSVSLSPNGKAMSLIDNLMKQKERIQEQKSELKASAIDSEGGLGSISEQLESYDEQLKSLDEQIATARTDQFVDNDTKKMENNTYKKPEPKTKEEALNAKMTNIIESANSVENAETISSVKATTDGEIGVLKQEIKLDGGRNIVSEAKLEKLAELETKSNDLIADISEELSDAVSDVEDVTAVKPTEPVEPTDELVPNEDELKLASKDDNLTVSEMIIQ